MSQEGASLPKEVEGSHDQATAPHDSIPAGVGSPTATVMPASSNPSFVGKLASAVNNTASFEDASPVVLSADEDNNAMLSKIASPPVLQAGEDSNTTSSKIASPVVLQANGDNNAVPKIASPTVLLAGEEKGNNAVGSKLASPVMMLHDCDDNKAGSHAGVDNNVARSKLASPAVLLGDDGNNGRSKIAIPTVPQVIVDNTTGSKLNSPTTLHAGEHNNGGFKVPKPVVLHAAQANKSRTKLAIQAMSHAGGNAGSPRLTRSMAAALHATKDNASKRAIQAVPRPYHAGKGNNAGLSKASRSVAVDAGESNAKEGKNNIAGEQRAHEVADVGGSSGKGKAIAAVEDADHDLHIFTERERRKKMKNMFSTLHGLLPQLPDKADKATIVWEAVTYIKTLERQIQKLEKLKMERKRAPAAQQQQLAVGASSSRAATARHPAPALPAPPAAAREVNLEDMVHSLLAQQAAANSALMTAAAGSSSSAATPHHQLPLPRGAVPFPAPAAGFQTWSGQNAVVSIANNEAYINLHCPRELGTLTKALFVLERNHIEVVTTTISTQDGFRMYGIHARATPASASACFPETLCAEDRFKLAVSEMLQMINNVI